MRLRTHLHIPSIPLARRQSVSPCTCPYCQAMPPAVRPHQTHDRWSLLTLVGVATATMTGGAVLACALHARYGWNLWLTLPVLWGLGMAVGWYGSGTVERPGEETP